MRKEELRNVPEFRISLPRDPKDTSKGYYIWHYTNVDLSFVDLDRSIDTSGEFCAEVVTNDPRFPMDIVCSHVVVQHHPVVHVFCHQGQKLNVRTIYQVCSLWQCEVAQPGFAWKRLMDAALSESK